ncbi:uncharacterized protein LOC141723376 [Apium graveolens]|uniref:uncharacterized protein LOC141723376 n=1 Tax=Apium graveolens TaxID=4045 RepID=UPI003D793B49
MSSFIQNLASMPQPHLLHELHKQLAQKASPAAQADNQAPPQNQAPAALVDNPAQVTPAQPQNQAPAALVDNPAQVTPAQPQLEAPDKPAVPQYKNFLQQYTQKEGLPLPVYQTSFDGELHSPQFRCTVVVNGESYVSSKVFPNRKAAEMDAARIALLNVLQQQEDNCSIDQEELIFCKTILKEYADKINAESPDYKTEKGDGSGFTSSLTFNGKQYVGEEGRNKKESQHLAARAVILSILDSDARGVISKIIKSKKKLICPAKGKGIGPVIVNENIVKTETQEPCTGNSSSVSAEPVSLFEASAKPNLEQLIVGSTSSKKRKRKNKKAENRVGIDAQVQVVAVPLSQDTTSTDNNDPACAQVDAVPSSQNTTTDQSDPMCAPSSCASPPGSDNAVLS